MQQKAPTSHAGRGHRQTLGCGGRLSALRRVATGPFDERQCITLEERRRSTACRLACLRPPEALLDDHADHLVAEEAGRFLSGLRRRGPWSDADRVAVHGEQPRALLGTAHVRAGTS